MALDIDIDICSQYKNNCFELIQRAQYGYNVDTCVSTLWANNHLSWNECDWSGFAIPKAHQFIQTAISSIWIASQSRTDSHQLSGPHDEDPWQNTKCV